MPAWWPPILTFELGPRLHGAMTKKIAALMVLAVTLVVGACAQIDTSVRTVKGDWSGYSQSYLQQAAKLGSMASIVAGRAFAGGSADAFRASVLNEVNGRPLGVGPLSFKAMPQGAATPALFVSFVFNPEPSFDSNAACDPAKANQAGGAPLADGSVRLVAAFCSSQRHLSGTVGMADGLASTDDPRFAALIRLVMIDLFPPHDPNFGPSCDSCP